MKGKNAQKSWSIVTAEPHNKIETTLFSSVGNNVDNRYVRKKLWMDTSALRTYDAT